MVFAASSSAARLASRTAATTRSCSVSRSSGSTAAGAIVSAVRSPLPVIVAVTRPPPAEPVTSRCGELLLGGDQLLLHLLRLLQQLRHVGLASGEHAPSVGRRSDGSWHAGRMRWLGPGVVALLVALTGCSATAAQEPRPATTSPTVAPRVPSPAPAPATPSPRPEPPDPAPPPPAPVVVLDPGHNGGNAAHPEIVNAQVPDGAGGTKPCNTTGTETDAGYPEHAFTWDVALRMRDRLTAAGVTVVLTRQDDAGVGPCVDVRGQLAGQVGAAAFVGIHGDGAAAGGRGFHVITSSLAPAGPDVADRQLGAGGRGPGRDDRRRAGEHLHRQQRARTRAATSPD